MVGGVVDIAEAALNIKQRIDTTAAEEALVQFERDKNELFFNPESGYFNTQGRDAYDGAPGTNSVLDDLKKRYSDPLGVNARVMFDRAADAHLTKSKADIGRHASKGLDAWEVATAQAQIENTIENASLYWNQPDNLRVQSAIGRQSVLDTAQREGVGPKATAERLQTYESSFAKAAVIAATMSSAAEGQDLFDTHSDKLEGPDRVKLENAITVKRDAEKTQADAQQAVISGARIA
ncbi:MAG: hypothetical protein GY937_15175, partial [bacterium]|nr:hypothetical protein [bacterium]